MANEITVLESTPENVRVLFYYPIPAEAREQGGLGTNPVPTPAAALPEEASAAFDGLGAAGVAMKAALDAGEAIFVTRSFRRLSGMTGPQLLANVREMYAKLTDDLLAEYEARYEHRGKVFNATS